MTGAAMKLQALNLPPMITFDEDLVPGGRRIPAGSSPPAASS